MNHISSLPKSCSNISDMVSTVERSKSRTMNFDMFLPFISCIIRNITMVTGENPTGDVLSLPEGLAEGVSERTNHDCHSGGIRN